MSSLLAHLPLIHHQEVFSGCILSQIHTCPSSWKGNPVSYRACTGLTDFRDGSGGAVIGYRNQVAQFGCAGQHRPCTLDHHSTHWLKVGSMAEMWITGIVRKKEIFKGAPTCKCQLITTKVFSSEGMIHEEVKVYYFFDSCLPLWVKKFRIWKNNNIFLKIDIEMCLKSYQKKMINQDFSMPNRISCHDL